MHLIVPLNSKKKCYISRSAARSRERFAAVSNNSLIFCVIYGLDKSGIGDYNLCQQVHKQSNL